MSEESKFDPKAEIENINKRRAELRPGTSEFEAGTVGRRLTEEDKAGLDMEHIIDICDQGDLKDKISKLEVCFEKYPGLKVIARVRLLVLIKEIRDKLEGQMDNKLEEKKLAARLDALEKIINYFF